MLISDMVGSDRRSSQMGAESNGDVMQVTSRQLADLFDFDSPIDLGLVEPSEWTGVRWEEDGTQCKASLAAGVAELRQLEYEPVAMWVLDAPGRCDEHLREDAKNVWHEEYVPCKCSMEG